MFSMTGKHTSFMNFTRVSAVGVGAVHDLPVELMALSLSFFFFFA